MRTATLCLLFMVACSTPHRDYNADKIAAVKDLDELMHVQRTVADPRFKMARKLSGKELSGNDFEAFIDMGRRLQLTAKRLPEFSQGDGWNGFAKQLGDQASKLEGYARSGEGTNTTQTALAIKKTCAACHGEYR